MYEALKFSPRKSLGILWVLGSIAWGVGLSDFPWKPEGTPFLFMSIGVIFFGIATLNSIVHNREPDHVFSEPWAHLVGMYCAWGFTVFVMHYLPLWAGASIFILMICIAVIICVPIYRHAYLKMRGRHHEQ